MIPAWSPVCAAKVFILPVCSDQRVNCLVAGPLVQPKRGSVCLVAYFPLSLCELTAPTNAAFIASAWPSVGGVLSLMTAALIATETDCYCTVCQKSAAGTAAVVAGGERPTLYHFLTGHG